MRHRIVLFVLLSALVVAGGWVVRRQSQPPRRPNVLLITMDTLRADRLNCYGNERIRTPHIDALAERGVLFERAYASVPITLPSHTTIMTGLYPHQHGVRDNGVYRLDPSLVTLAETLRDAGYETAAFVSAFVLDRRFRIDQGFDHFDDEMVAPLRTDQLVTGAADLPEHSQRWIATWQQPYQRRADETVRRALDWLAGRRDGDRPCFLWVHLFDPHSPYQPPSPWDTCYDAAYAGTMDGTTATFAEKAAVSPGLFRAEDIGNMIARYDGEVSYADEQIGRLIAAWPDDDHSLVVFTSDHGEAFGEHRTFWEHMGEIYQENVHVPLILVGAEGVPPGSRRDDLVGSVDILPTVLDVVGLPSPDGLPGRSLLDAARKRGPGEGIYTETRCAISAIPTDLCYRGVRTPEWSLIIQIEKPKTLRAVALFDPSADAAELVNRFATSQPAGERSLSLLEALMEMGRDDDADPASFWAMDDDAERQDPLRSLGYVR